MKRSVQAAAIVAGFLALSLLGCGRSAGTKYRTAPVTRGPIEAQVSATGTLRPVEQVEVGSQVSGTVYRLHADYNDRVRKNQVLCELDPSSFRARAVQSEAAVARADAGLKEARRQLDRARELLAKDFIAKAEVESHEADVAQHDADLKQARAQLQAARVDLDHATIRAPIDGVVISRSVDLGQTVAASLQAPKLFVIANDLSHMQVETRIDEADIGLIKSGLPVRFTVDAFQDQTFQGQVEQVRLEPIVDQGVTTYTTVIRTDNPDQKLRPGMTANVSVLVDRRDDALQVPAAALRFRMPTEGGGRRGRGEAGGATRADGAGQTGGSARADEGGAPGASGTGAVGGTHDALARGGAAGSGQGDPSSTPRGSGRARIRGDSSGVAAGSRQGGAWAGRGSGRRGMAAGANANEGAEPPRMKPGTVYAMRNGKPVRIALLTGISDGAHIEIQTDQLSPGDPVVIGIESQARGQNLQPPPGMGGSPFGGGRGGGGGRGR